MHTTVKNLIFDQTGTGRLLLVHERGDGKPNGKPPGWGMAGGGVEPEENVADIYREIIAMLKKGHIFKDEVLIYIPKNDRYILAAIRETLEETGFLVRVERELFQELHSNHAVIIYQSKIIDGALKKESPETDNADWFFYDELPQIDFSLDQSKAIYPSEERRILKAIEVLGIKEELDGLKLQVFKAEKEDEYSREYLAWYLASSKEVSNGAPR